MVRRLHEQGASLRAAELARWIEIRALGKLRKSRRALYDASLRQRGCSVRGCTTYRVGAYRPWCTTHAPRFLTRRAA